jgi:hypothetical protein
MAEGVDYAFSRPNIGQLAALGKVFACRYGGMGSSTKHLTPAEAVELSTNNISIVANVEGAADGLLGGFNAGVSWAQSAEAHFRRCGMPPDRPIYLSVDFNVTAAQWTTVANALRGAATVLGHARVGVYGGRRAIEWARRDNVATWFWQTYAWSSGVWVPGNHIEQYLNDTLVAGAKLDLDRSIPVDYGQWILGGNAVNERELRIISNSYQVLYEEAYEHDPIKWVTNLDTGQWIEIPNLPLRREMRIEAKLDHLISLVEALGAGDPDTAAIIAAMRAEFDAQLAEIEVVVDRQIDQAFTGGADGPVAAPQP